MVKRIGLHPVSKYNIHFGVVQGVSRNILIRFSSHLSRISISCCFNLYHASQFVRILFNNRDSLKMNATSKWNGPKHTSFNIEHICLLTPIDLLFLERTFFMLLPSVDMISPKYFSLSTFSSLWSSSCTSLRLSNPVFASSHFSTPHLSMWRSGQRCFFVPKWSWWHFSTPNWSFFELDF